MQTKTNIPTILVIFGATGDLMKKKIIPSVYHLYVNKRLPKDFRVIGVARRELTDKQFQKHVETSLRKSLPKINKSAAKKVCEYFTYSQAKFQNVSGYKKLKAKLDEVETKWKICANKMFYLAVPPEHFETIFKNMAKVELNKPCGGQLGWARMLIEKPFGEDLKSAKKLFTLLHRYFKKEQLYFIDHYLAKEIIQAISHFRFSNNLFESSWDKNSIEKIDIRLFETIGAEDRGAFYDRVGALRDVLGNHLLQMLVAITMEMPRAPSAASIRKLRAEMVEKLRPWTAARIKKHTFHAQYSGYRAIEDVKKTSTTETYAKLRTELIAPAWRGVPIVMEAGKRMKKTIKEVVVTFKHPTLCVACPSNQHVHNSVTFRMAPNDEIIIEFWTKVPGFEKKLEKRAFSFFLYERQQKKQYVEEYAELIYNCMIGDQSIFVSQEEIEAQWRFIDPIVRTWKKKTTKLTSYSPNTDLARKYAKHLDVTEEFAKQEMDKDMAIVGLGKMGASMARRMMDQRWNVVGYNRSRKTTDELAKEGMIAAYSLKEVVALLPPHKVIWLMVPSGKAVDEVIFGKHGLAQYLSLGDVIIDGGNSYYKDTIRRATRLKKIGVTLLDAGTSGGPEGARKGACLMIGGRRRAFKKVELLFKDFAMPDGYQFFNGNGAGHFVKMIHNGIEYGMMQAIAEGFAIMKKSPYKLDLTRVADVYNHGSVIESSLMGWLKDAFVGYGENLKRISGVVSHTGEGKWTVKTAHAMNIADKVIHEALLFRYRSEKNPSYTGQVVSALRGEFGGHPVLKKQRKKK
jgi:glucose-6-phosphate 1-dehydrogenase